MARPNFDLDLATGTFTFDNGHVTIVGKTDIGQPAHRGVCNVNKSPPSRFGIGDFGRGSPSAPL
jgi:hypothetical protein